MASRGEKLEVAMSEMWTVVRIEYEDTRRWFRKCRGVVTFTSYGREAKLAGAKQCVVLDDVSTRVRTRRWIIYLRVVEHEIRKNDQVESPP